MDPAREKELLRRWQTDHSEPAAKQLFGAVRARIEGSLVSRHCREIASSYRMDCESLLQDALEAALRKISSGEFDPEGTASFNTWCVGIFKKKYLEELRKQGIRRRLLRIYATAREFAEPWDPVKRAIEGEHLQLLGEAIARLPDSPEKPLRTVFCLFEGFELVNRGLIGRERKRIGDIAAQFEKSNAWVSKKLVEGRVILNRKLGSKLDLPHRSGCPPENEQ